MLKQQHLPLEEQSKKWAVMMDVITYRWKRSVERERCIRRQRWMEQLGGKGWPWEQWGRSPEAECLKWTPNGKETAGAKGMRWEQIDYVWEKFRKLGRLEFAGRNSVVWISLLFCVLFLRMFLMNSGACFQIANPEVSCRREHWERTYPEKWCTLCVFHAYTSSLYGQISKKISRGR